VKNPKNILVIRFSAMGDVVLTVPVIQNLLSKYPDTQITLLTNPFFHPFYNGIPNLTLYPVDLKGKHKGIFGLSKLVRELRSKKKFDTVIDLHSVLRTWVIGSLFKIKGTPVFRIDKGRADKRAFINQKNHTLLQHSTERYLAVFEKAGLDFTLEKKLLNTSENSNFDIQKYINSKDISIGIAPFAAHQSKQWGIDKIENFIEQINQKKVVKFYLFGGGKNEVNQLNELVDKFNNTTNLAGSFKLAQELKLLKELDVLIAMDSGNMHIASLLGIPVISIWGGTHPDIGFSALYQPTENSIQISTDKLPCRPCSVFGTNDCQLKENLFACMTMIEPSDVIKHLENMGIFSKKKK
jgi:ADP-heptose:LPS heptosyltransferase